MRDDQFRFLSVLGQLPSRLTTEQAAWVLNCQPHDIPTLVAHRLLKPLGNPAPNSIKFFATDELLESAKERSWLAKVTATINQHWHEMNSKRKVRTPGILQASLTVQNDSDKYPAYRRPEKKM